MEAIKSEVPTATAPMASPAVSSVKKRARARKPIGSSNDESDAKPARKRRRVQPNVEKDTDVLPVSKMEKGNEKVKWPTVADPDVAASEALFGDTITLPPVVTTPKVTERVTRGQRRTKATPVVIEEEVVEKETTPSESGLIAADERDPIEKENLIDVLSRQGSFPTASLHCVSIIYPTSIRLTQTL